MTRFGVIEDYDYSQTHKRHRLTIWSGSFMSDYEGEAYSLPKGNGYMVSLGYGGKVRVSCPAPRNADNWVQVDEAINAALNAYFDNKCNQSPTGKHHVTHGSCNDCGQKNFN